jgi:hypothetical protein
MVEPVLFVYFESVNVRISDSDIFDSNGEVEMVEPVLFVYFESVNVRISDSDIFDSVE